MNYHYSVTILYCSLKCNKHSAFMPIAQMPSRMRGSASGKRSGTVEHYSCWFHRYRSGNVVRIEDQQHPSPGWCASTNVCNIFTMPENIFHLTPGSSPESPVEAHSASVDQTQTRHKTHSSRAPINCPASLWIRHQKSSGPATRGLTSFGGKINLFDIRAGKHIMA
mgnify:FL=1